MFEIHETTAGLAQTVDGGVVIQFVVLDDGMTESFCVDVDAYAEELARDLLAAICERNYQRSEEE